MGEMFFKYEEPFEEFFSYCVVILNKTWRDMRATRQDFSKVFDVVREQLETSLLSEKQERPKTFDQFKANVKSYAEISKKWQNDAKNRDTLNNNKSVMELRNHLEPEIKDLIRQQRANFMVEGTRFLRNKKTGEAAKSQQCRYVKLHANHKTIYVGDWNSDKSVPTLEDLEPRLHVADIRAVKTGSECDFIKEYKKDFKDQYSWWRWGLTNCAGTTAGRAAYCSTPSTLRRGVVCSVASWTVWTVLECWTSSGPPTLVQAWRRLSPVAACLSTLSPRTELDC